MERDELIEKARMFLKAENGFECDPGCDDVDGTSIDVAAVYGVPHDSSACSCECHEYTDKMADFALEHAKQPQWTAIETAPKDETWVILTDGVKVAPGYWGNSYFHYNPKWLTYAYRSDHAPVELDGEPTHWMPLPEPYNPNNKEADDAE